MRGEVLDQARREPRALGGARETLLDRSRVALGLEERAKALPPLVAKPREAALHGAPEERLFASGAAGELEKLLLARSEREIVGAEPFRDQVVEHLARAGLVDRVPRERMTERLRAH